MPRTCTLRKPSSPQLVKLRLTLVLGYGDNICVSSYSSFVQEKQALNCQCLGQVKASFHPTRCLASPYVRKTVLKNMFALEASCSASSLSNFFNCTAPFLKLVAWQEPYKSHACQLFPPVPPWCHVTKTKVLTLLYSRHTCNTLLCVCIYIYIFCVFLHVALPVKTCIVIQSPLPLLYSSHTCNSLLCMRI